MIDRGRKNILGIMVNAVDYEATEERVLRAARNREALTVAALSVHSVMTGALEPEHRYRLNRIDLAVPDGQPVRWALNALHGARLHDRVYGPNLMLRVCARAAEEGLPVYFYGSRAEVLEALARRLLHRFPRLRIAGMQDPPFRRLSPSERARDVATILRSGAAITFVGLGSPKQEVWCYEHRDILSMPLLAVGAAFDFHAGVVRQAPPVLQRAGLEWAFRLAMEPRRLWRRYAYLNPLYVGLIAAQAAGIRFETGGVKPAEEQGSG